MSKTKKRFNLGRIPLPEQTGKVIKSKKEKYLKRYLEEELKKIETGGDDIDNRYDDFF